MDTAHARTADGERDDDHDDGDAGDWRHARHHCDTDGGGNEYDNDDGRTDIISWWTASLRARRRRGYSYSPGHDVAVHSSCDG